MSQLFEIKPVDRQIYDERIRDFLPDRLIDIHTHIWLQALKAQPQGPSRTVLWPGKVARDNSVEDLVATYKLLFPGKQVTPLLFGNVGPADDAGAMNGYVRQSARDHQFPALAYALPAWSAARLEEEIIGGGFLGCKVYLDLAPAYIPVPEIRIFDFLPRHQLEVLDRHGWIVMLHIPRNDRLKDPVNLAQMLEIEERYPNIRLVIAHVGRAYCPEDVGNAFEILSGTRNMLFDISANCNELVFRQLIEAVGPRRILFGSDLPILRMRTRRICEQGFYVNLVPKGLYGDISDDRHLREAVGDEAEQLTFFMYEEIDAFRRAAEACRLTAADIEDIFYRNARNMLDRAGSGASLDAQPDDIKSGGDGGVL